MEVSERLKLPKHISQKNTTDYGGGLTVKEDYNIMALATWFTEEGIPSTDSP